MNDTAQPKTLSEYAGQPHAVAQLEIMIAAAKQRNEPLDHILLTGPGGLGKTTLANVIANEMGVGVTYVTASNVDNVEQLRATLFGLEEGQILFVDEVHALNLQMIETLYTVMEGFYFDGFHKLGKTVIPAHYVLKPFTVIAATTNPEKLTPSLRTRFAQQISLDYYEVEHLSDLLMFSAKRAGIHMTPKAAKKVAGCSRGTPRTANALLSRVRDMAQVKYNGHADEACVEEALRSLQIDHAGLDAMDRKYLVTILRHGNVPMGISMLAAALRENKQVIEEVREPFLIEQGFICRTPKGRVVSDLGIKHLEGVKL